MSALCCEKCRADIIEHLKSGPVYIACTADGFPTSTTYGELLENAYPKILAPINDEKRGCFIDLGAGTGRGLLYAIANGFRKAKGVEIVEERVEYGNNNIISPLSGLIKDRVTLSHANIMQLEKDYFADDAGGVVIWWSNLCFPEAERSEFWSRLYEYIDESTVVLCSLCPVASKQWAVMHTIAGVPQSWEENTDVYALQKKLQTPNR